MKRIRIERPKARRARLLREPGPLDPRDPDVVRSKELTHRVGRRSRRSR